MRQSGSQNRVIAGAQLGRLMVGACCSGEMLSMLSSARCPFPTVQAAWLPPWWAGRGRGIRRAAAATPSKLKESGPQRLADP